MVFLLSPKATTTTSPTVAFCLRASYNHPADEARGGQPALKGVIGTCFDSIRISKHGGFSMEPWNLLSLMALNGADDTAVTTLLRRQRINVFPDPGLGDDGQRGATGWAVALKPQPSVVGMPICFNNYYLAIGVTAMERSYDIRADKLPVQSFASVQTTVTALNGTLLRRDGPVRIILTPKLSGCTLCFQKATQAAGDVRIAHIQPQPKGPGAVVDTGRALQKWLKDADPRFAGEPARKTYLYGSLDIDTDSMQGEILLLQKAGKWTLYVQKILPLSGDGTTIAGVDVVHLF